MTLVKLFIAKTIWQSKPINRDRVIASLIAFLLGLGATGTVYWIWTTDQPATALWIGLTLWLTVVVVGASFWLLALGQQ